MLFIYCPYCQEKRSEAEFSYAGEAFIARPAEPEALDQVAWADYAFHRTNPKGRFFEQWQHQHGCNKYFVVERDTVTNEIYSSSTIAEAAKLRAENGSTKSPGKKAGSAKTQPKRKAKTKARVKAGATNK